jgi:ubiquinone/menaquinone biosynthesis C-methylase UbiE
VLDIATGTGIAAEAIAAIIGPSGGVIAADISPAMVNKARARLTKQANILSPWRMVSRLPSLIGALTQLFAMWV